MGQDLGQKDKIQDRNQEEAEEIEEEDNFGIIQGHGEGSLMTQDDSGEQESAKTTFFQVEYTLEYPEISYEGAESNEELDKMEDFSEEEHQEAGEGFADYPSDFSSCEYVDFARNANRVTLKQSLTIPKIMKLKQVKEFQKITTVGDCFGVNSELCCKDELNKMTNADFCLKLEEQEDNDALQSWTEDVFLMWSTSEPNTKDLNQAESECSTRVSNPVSSSCGSVDDSFFFNDESEVLELTEERQMEDEDEEEERRREQARIQAFYRFYGDQDDDSDKEERQTKVQFRMEGLSQVIHFDTDSSREYSSSSDEEEEDEEEEQGEEEEHEMEKEEKGTDEEHTDHPDEIETCPSVMLNEDVLPPSQESQEVEILTQADSSSAITDTITESQQTRVQQKTQVSLCAEVDTDPVLGCCVGTDHVLVGLGCRRVA
ncbi:hypothetical protein WMY93_030395 [Mugilogobius chulae]|uniref:Uncharacterized protein n=1 Tax=Mugilogobius chulae TaxID=88201 RepID=A0AAW0MP53_9GOBI